jgi:hypothetical protein
MRASTRRQARSLSKPSSSRSVAVACRSFPSWNCQSTGTALKSRQPPVRAKKASPVHFRAGCFGMPRKRILPAVKRDLRTCSACSKELDAKEGVELWGSWFCSGCFVGQAAEFGRPLAADDVARIRRLGRELAGFLPPEILEMVLKGFYKRASGSKKAPSRDEVSRTVVELQRITATACFRQILNLLKTWEEIFGKFVQEQEADIRSKVRRLTDPDEA